MKRAPTQRTRLDSPRKNFFTGIVLGSLVAVVWQLGCYFIARGSRSDFGIVMFCFVPFLSGFTVAAVVRKGRRIAACCIVSSIVTSSFLLYTGKEGIIAQEVTEWQRPTSIGLRITENTLPGREWLSFNTASYELSTVGAKTKLVRHTMIGSRLYPRWYWRPLERWGVISEHDFVLSNVKRWTQQAP